MSGFHGFLLQGLGGTNREGWGMNGVEVLNWKTYSSGSLVGFFDLAVCGIVVTGCKAFRKLGDGGEDRLWFAWPATRGTTRDGGEVWNDIVQAAEPTMRHLQRLVRPQLRSLLDAGGGVQAQRPSDSKRSEGSEAYQESRKAAQSGDDIPF